MKLHFGVLQFHLQNTEHAERRGEKALWTCRFLCKEENVQGFVAT